MKRPILIVLSLVAVSFCWSDEPQVEQTVEMKHEFEVDNDFVIEIENLMGRVTLDFSGENKVECITKGCAFAKDEKKAKELVDKLRMKVEGDRKKISVSAQYPLSEYSIYFYPASDKEQKKRGNKAKFYKNKLRYQGENVTVMAEPSLASIYLFADISLKVPASGKVRLKNYIGSVHTQNLSCDLTTESITGTLHIEKGQGKLSFSTSSGNIEIKEQKGDINGFAGSGNVELAYCAGNVEMNVGSAGVTCKACEFVNAEIKSGSGTISLDKTTADLALIACGSGKVQADSFTALKTLKIETGSGSVRLKGDLSRVDEFFIQTGSGNINLVSTPFPELAFDAKSGSGDVEVKVPGMKIEQTSPNVVLASKGEASEKIAPEKIATLRSGSGDIRLGTSRKKQSVSKAKKEKESPQT